MNRVRRFSLLVLVLFVMAGGFLAGCGDKYKNMSVTSDAQQGLTLYVGEEEANTGKITFTVNGAGDKISTDLVFSFESHEEDRIVEIVDTAKEGNKTTVTLKAPDNSNGGETTLVALTKEGGKSTSVKISCVIKANSMKANSNYKPLIVAGNSMTINASDALVFAPSGTTQKHIKFTLANQLQGVSISESGLLVVDKDATAKSVDILATNLDNSSLEAQTITVKIIRAVEKEDVVIKDANGDVVTAINLSTNRVNESSIMLRAYITNNSDENYITNFSLVATSDTTLNDTSCATTEKIGNGNDVIIRAVDKGSCLLKVTIKVQGYDAIVQEITLPVVCDELPSSISVNGNNENYELEIYSKYNNALGTKFATTVGSEFIDDKRYVLQLDKAQEENVKIFKEDRTELKPMIVDGENYNDDFDIMDSGSVIYVKGLNANAKTLLRFVAYASIGHEDETAITVTLTTLIGAETLDVKFPDSDSAIRTNTIFVEEGKSVSINYEADNENASTKGIVVVENSDNKLISAVVAEGENPLITITGTKSGILSAKLVLPNGTETKDFSIYVFKPVDDVFASVDSPLENKNIEQVEYSYGSLSKFVMSLGTGTAVKFATNPDDGTIYDLNCTAQNPDDLDVISVSSSGYIVSKNVGTATVNVTIKTLKTQDNGTVAVVELTLTFDVVVYIPISSISLSQKTATLIWKEDTNYTQYQNKEHITKLDLSIFPRSAYVEADQISWVTSTGAGNFLLLNPSADGRSCEIVASRGDVEQSTMIATVKVFVTLYGTTISHNCIITIVKPQKVTDIAVNIKGQTNNKTMYFDSRKGLSINEGAFDANGVVPKTIVTTVLPENATNKTIKYTDYDSDLIYVDKLGNVYPLSAGKTTIKVFAEDRQNWLGEIDSYKEITVIVADGKTEDTAFLISSEADFVEIKNGLNYFYALTDNILLTNPISCMGIFGGVLNGNGHYLQNLSFEGAKNYLFDAITTPTGSDKYCDQATIENLNISANVNLANASETFEFAVLAKQNNAMIRNVKVSLGNAKVTNTYADANIYFAGLVIENTSFVMNCSMTGNITIAADTVTNLKNLEVAGLIGTNNGYIYGGHNNYQYSNSYLINFDAIGSISVNNLTAENSYIGGFVAKNIKTIGSDNTGLGYGNGIAVSVKIDAKTISNVGGMVGYNEGYICNSLSYGDIHANNNVGGLVGVEIYTGSMTSYTKINSSIVELYQDPLDTTHYAGIVGNDNVGGLVGLAKGNIYKNDEGEVVYAYSTIIKNSYVKSYNTKSYVSSQNIAGGLVGKAEKTDISNCYANVGVDGKIVGGLIGQTAEGEVKVSDSFARATVVNKLVAETSGSFAGEILATTNVSNFYTTMIDTPFVGKDENSLFAQTNSFRLVSTSTDSSEKTSDELKTLSTYENAGWSISMQLDAEKQWYLTNETSRYNYNDGYPTLLFGKYVLDKKQASEIYVTPKDNVQKINDTIIVLRTGTEYRLSDVLNIKTNISDASRMIILSSKDGVLKNCDLSVLSDLSSIMSTSEDIITLTFKLYSNADVECKIQIAFVKPIDKVQLSRSALSLKKGKSGTFTGMFLDANDNLIQANNYLLGVDVSGLETETTSYTDYFEFSQFETIQNGIVYANNPAIINSKSALKTSVNIDVYAKIDYVDLAGQNQSEHVKINSTGASLAIDIYEGASEISVNRAQIDMTLMNIISLQVTITTDMSNDKLFVYENSEDKVNYIQIVQNDHSSVVSKNISQNNDYKLKLTVTSEDYYPETKQYVFGFELQFLDEYLSLTDSKEFAKALATSLRFVPESNANLDAVVEISAKPQSLLKIDLNHFPSGQNSIKADSNGKTYNAYTPTEFPSNTLTPGQVGLLTIDLYPEYSLFDELTITSSKNSNGDAISFIQVIFFESESEATARYMEIKPNPVIVENGIVLTKQSYTNQEIGIANSKFNGTLYVKTLISTRVPNEQIFTVTVSCFNYVEENGQTIKKKVIDKSIDLIISPKPDVSIRVAEEDTHKAFVKTMNVAQELETKEFYIIARGTTQKIITELKNYAISDLTYQYYAYRDYIDENNVKQSESLKADTLCEFDGNSLMIFPSTRAGTRIVINAKAKKTINGIEETYSSESIEFYVVDYILTDVNVSTANQSKILSVNVATATRMYAKFSTIHASKTGEDDDNGSVNEIISKIEADQTLISTSRESNENAKYWFAVSRKGGTENATNWHNGGKYNDGDPKYEILTDEKTDAETGTKTNTFMLYATREAKLSENLQFKIKFAYYYSINLADSEANLKMEFADTNDEATENANLIDSNITLEINQTTSIDNPYPIYTINEFLSMEEDKDYILMKNLEFGAKESLNTETTSATTSAYTPFEINVKSFDGNCKNITIGSNGGQIFNFSGDTTENLGLFSTIASNTIIKNVYVVYENAGIVNLTGTGATTLNFGGIAGTNNGIITNCIVTFKSSSIDATESNNGNITFETNDNVSVNVAGFVGDNNGMITYSTVTASDGISSDGSIINPYKNATISAKGNVSGFVSQNSNLISNCQVLFVGVSNQTSQNLGSRTAGFVATNSGNIYYSSVEGQYIPSLAGKDHEITINDLFQTVGEGDDRINKIKSGVSGTFARIHSNGNIAGFVYSNSGAIKDSYTNMPMDTQSRTSGFVFSNTGNATILSSYTLSYYDGTIQSSTANTPFVGTNELGEVQNDDTCQIKFCYYINDRSFNESDKAFADPATRISFEDAIAAENYVGFDYGTSDYSTWGRDDAKSNVIYLVANKFNSEISKNFARKIKKSPTETENGNYVYVTDAPETGIEEGVARCPYLIATADQFIDKFNGQTLINNKSFRLINNIDMSTLTDATSINKLQSKIFAGDLDGNGMEISGIRIVGSSTSSSSSAVDATEKSELIASSSYGLFKQIGTYIGETSQSTNEDNLSHIRNIRFNVDEISKSTSTFTGILAGVIVDTALKDVEINTQNLTVLGKNITGGVAGAILGNSTLYNVSSNANVTSAYVSFENDEYQTKFAEVKHFKNTLLDTEKTGLDKANSATSYAGGIAGVINIKSPIAENELYTNISHRNSNADMMTVKGDITITAEIVGGICGYLGADAYISNSQFEISTNDSQRLKGYYVAGGLIGENYGVVNLCKVEVNYTNVNAFDNATNNNTGNNLFENADTNPVYIGGLVGVNYGGYITTSYSKTNVYHHNASYAGGLIGLATNNGKLPNNAQSKADFKDYRPTILREVYSTGNVFAGANGTLSNIKTDEKGNQTADSISTNHAGGLFGKFEAYYIPDTFNRTTETGETLHYADIDGSGKFINLDNTYGLNGFHKPQAYNVQSGYKQDGNDRISRITFADLATGFTEKITLSNGTTKTIKHDATLGAFVGEMTIANGTSDNKDFVEVSFVKAPMFVNYVYNDNQISVSSATSANGLQIDHIAKVNVNSDKFNKQYISETNKYNFTAEDNHKYDVYAGYKDGIFTSKELNINTNLNYVDIDQEQYYIAPNNVYLLYRGLDVGRFVVVEQGASTGQVKSSTYHSFKNTIDGIYFGWNVLYWEFANPVYPKFAARDTSEYILIKTEEQLRNVQSGLKYMLVADIYLSDLWEPREFVGTIIGASRVSDDLSGIASGSRYAIYNINIKSTDSSVGFFTNFDRAELSNINFVFGTRIDPSKLTNQSGWQEDKDKWKESWNKGFGKDNLSDPSITKGIKFGSESKNAYNVGTLAANVNSTSKISACQVYFVNNVVNGTTKTEVNSSISNIAMATNNSVSSINVGGIAGNVSGKSSITSSGISYVDYKPENKAISYVSDDDNVFNLSNIPSNTTFNVGGAVGQIDTTSSISAFEAKGINLSLENTLQTSVGGAIGNIDIPQSTTKKVSSKKGEIKDINVSGVKIKVVGKPFAAIKDENGKTIGYNQIGGVIGGIASMSNNSEINSSKLIDENTSVEKINTISLSGTFVTPVYVGGGVGSIENCNANKFNISDMQIALEDNTKFAEISAFGGICGYALTGDQTIENCNTSKVDINLEKGTFVAESSIGGILGKFDTNVTISGGKANGTISINNVSEQGGMFVAGIVGYSTSNAKIIINSTIGDVDINLANISSNGLTVSGGYNLRVDDGSGQTANISNLLLTGSITSKEYGEAAIYGFANSNNLSGSNIYCLTTLKVSGPNVYETVIGGSNSITYHQNISGQNRKNTNNVQRPKAYSTICGEINGTFEGRVSDINKVNPTSINSENVSTLEKGKYYYVDGSVDNLINKLGENSVDCNIIANSVGSSNVVSISKSITIAKNTMISGVELKLASGFAGRSPIAENDGFVFNTFISGNIKLGDEETDKNIQVSGFVGINNGIILSSGTMVEIDVNNQKNVYASGFADENRCQIAYSFATGLIKNMDYKSENLAQSGNAGFAMDGSGGTIVNSYSATSIFDVVVENKSKVEHYTNTFAFVGKDYMGRTEDCYYDSESSSNSGNSEVRSGVTAETYSQLSSVKDGKGNNSTLFNGIDQTRYVISTAYNFEYPMSLTYSPNGSYTGNGKRSNQPFVVNNIGRLASLNAEFEKGKDNKNGYDFFVEIRNNIDASLIYEIVNGNEQVGKFESLVNENGNITITANSQVSIYGIDLNPKVVDNVGIEGVFSTTKEGAGVFVTNVGVVGKLNSFVTAKETVWVDYGPGFGRPETKTVYKYASYLGLLVGKTSKLKLENCYAILSRQFVYSNPVSLVVSMISVKPGNKVAAGILVGYASENNQSDNGYIKNCFASGDIDWSLDSTNVSLGGLVGYNKNVGIEKCFASGTISVTDNENAKLKDIEQIDFSIGGLIGKAENKPKINSSYSNVSIYNRTTEGWDKYHFGPIVGSGEIDSDQINTKTFNVSIEDRKSYNLIFTPLIYLGYNLDEEDYVKNTIQPIVKMTIYDVFQKNCSKYIKDKLHGIIPDDQFSFNWDYSRVKENPLSISYTYTFYVTSISVSKISGALYDKGVSLQKDDKLYDCKLSDFMTKNTTPFEDGNASTKHLPIQKAFAKDQIVYTWLEINDSSVTGSKMSPVGLHYPKFDVIIKMYYKYKYFYVGNDMTFEDGGLNKEYLYKKFINLNGYTIENGTIGIKLIENLTLANGNIKNAMYAIGIEVKDSYWFNVNSIGNMYNYGFVKTAINSVFDSCSVNGTINTTSSAASAFALNSNNSSIFRNIEIGNQQQTIVEVFAPEDGSSSFAGILTCGNDDSAYILSPKIYNLKFDSDKPIGAKCTENITIGGVCDYVSSGKVSIYGNIVIENLANEIKVTTTDYGQRNYNDPLRYAALRFGGIAGSLDGQFINNKVVFSLSSPTTINIQSISYNSDIYMGALFGEMENCSSWFVNIKVLSDVNFVTTGAYSPSLNVGLIGLLSDFAGDSSMTSIKFDNIKVSYTNEIQSNASYNDFNINFGGVFGCVPQIKVNGIYGPKETSFVSKSQSAKTYSIGGIIGRLGYEGTTKHSTMEYVISHNVYCTISGGRGIAYVGGMIGYNYDSELEFGTRPNIIINDSQGDVIATSSAVGGEMFNLKDTRTLNSEIIEHSNGNYKGRLITSIGTKQVFIPLAVGGVFGYTNRISDGVTKSSGSVRALLTNLTSDYINYLNPAWNYENGAKPENTPYDGHYEIINNNYYHEHYNGAIENNETIQCRAGAYAGLTTALAVSGMTDTESVKNKEMSFVNSNQGIIGIPMVKVTEDDKKKKVFEYLGYINTYQLSLNTYKISDCYLPVSYGNDTSKYNYYLPSNKSATDILSESSYNEDNIFEAENLDFSAKLYQSYYGLEVTNYLQQGSKWGYSVKWTHVTDKVIPCAGDDNLQQKTASVFAGFRHGGTIYNRSYWSIPQSTIDDDEIGMPGGGKIYLYYIKSFNFLVAPHWAGGSIGGVVS